MKVEKIDGIHIVFTSDELYTLATIIARELEHTITSHINNLQEVSSRMMVFRQQNNQKLAMMTEFYTLSGYNDLGEDTERALLGKVDQDD